MRKLFNRVIEKDMECTSIYILGRWYDREYKKDGTPSIFMRCPDA